jgi:hypothetical protein
MERLNPRVARIVALAAPTEREKKSWYFQRYVQHLPCEGILKTVQIPLFFSQFIFTGEIVLFDRSWYNRGGVEHVMGFCTDEEYDIFLKHCPIFENMLLDSGFFLIKYWFSVRAPLFFCVLVFIFVGFCRSAMTSKRSGSKHVWRTSRRSGNSRRWTYKPAANGSNTGIDSIYIVFFF